MKIGFLFHDPVPDLDGLARRMERLAALGYRGIELSASYPFPYRLEDVIALSEKYRLPVVSLLSGWSYAAEGLCLSRPEADIRRRAVERLTEYVGYAARLQSILVVGLMQGLRSDEPSEERANERIADGLRQVARVAEERGVRVVLEPVCHMQVGFNNTAAEAAAMTRRVGSPALGYMLDTIHMNVEERSVLETIREHGRHIHHFHLCETNGGPFGSGGLDFPAVLAALKESGYQRYASVKIYRGLAWEEAAQNAAKFLGLAV